MVIVKCKKCGRSAEAESFVLDNFDKMMICGQCVKDKKTKKTIQSVSSFAKEMVQPERSKIDIKQEMKKQIPEVIDSSISVIKLDAERVKYKCPKCGYGFIYNIVSGRPKVCNYCSEPVGKLNIREGVYDL